LNEAFKIAAENLDKKIHTVTLEQLEAMNLSPFMERAYFGRTSKEWRELLDAKQSQPKVEKQ
jgi:hypothetical protein